MWGMTPPPAMVALISVSNSSSPLNTNMILVTNRLEFDNRHCIYAIHVYEVRISKPLFFQVGVDLVNGVDLVVGRYLCLGLLVVVQMKI